MHLPFLEGLMRRRLLINYRADADVVRSLLPAPFRPKPHQGHTVVGICLTRLESIRPCGLSAWTG